MDESLTKRHLTRRPTGEPPLDAVLRGGLPVGLLTVVSGPVGSGKSLLGHQMARLAGDQALYALATGVPTEATAACFADPTPIYVDLLPAMVSEGLDAALAWFERHVAASHAELVVLDGLDRLLAGADAAVRRESVRRLAETAWRSQAALVVLSTDEAPEAVAAAALVMVLTPGDAFKSRTLRVVKSLGAEALPGDHAIRLGPLGLTFDSAVGAVAGVAGATPVSGLGARILTTFRTAKTARASELAVLLGHDLEAVEGALLALAEAGYVESQPLEGEETAYALIKAA
jgi:hypothetical protein